MFSLNHFFQRSSSSGSAPNKTNSPKHLEQGFITRGRSISWKKEKNYHLEAIISVSLSSCKLNLPTYLIGLLLVAKIARLFDLSIRGSDANWFLGRGKFTVWPSSSNKKSLHAILSGDHRKSLRKATSLFSRLVQEYFVVAGLTNTLKISPSVSNRKDFPQLVGPTIKMLLFFLSTCYQGISHSASEKILIDFVVSQDLFCALEPMLFSAYFNTIRIQCFAYYLHSGLAWPF